MNWFYALHGQQAGPVDDAELDRLVRAGTIDQSTLVWYSGMAEWQSYAAARPAAVGPGDSQAQCSQCGQIFPADEIVRVDNYNVCAVCKPMLLQKLREGVSPAIGAHGIAARQYGSFGTRFGAVFLDGLILSPVIYGPVIYTLVQRGPDGVQHPSATLTTLQYVVPILYETFMIGRYGATLGKMACKLQVVRADGARVSYARALGRHFAKFLSGIILGIGYFMAAFDQEKRALHDHICDTRVVLKPVVRAAAPDSL